MNNILEQIIDELHPKYKPVADEQFLYGDEEVGHYGRVFQHKDTGDKFFIKWKIQYGTPDTVKTTFETVEEFV